ncbi:solute carrier family 35 member G1-like protein, partial [Leptotrombidium deliense]
MNGNNDKEAAKESPKLTIYDRLRRMPASGITFALFSAFFIATGSLIVKLVDELHAIEVAVIRSLVQAVFYLTFILITQTSFRPAKGETLFLSLRCIFGFMSVICSFVSLRLIPLGDASAIIYSAPVFITIVARLFLKEKCDIVNIIAIFVTAAGVVLITKPKFLFPDETWIEEEHRLIGTLLAVGSAFGSACAFVSIRKLQKTPSSVVIFWHSII